MAELFGKRASTHLSPELLRKLDVPIQDELDGVFRHLADHCPACRDAWAASGGRLTSPSRAHVYQAAFARVPRLLERIEKEQRTVSKEFEELLSNPQPKRLRKLERAISRFTSPLLAELLIEKAREVVTSDPEESMNLARCAELVALRIPHDHYGEGFAVTCLARARANHGNALRVSDDPGAARLLLESALELFWTSGNGDPLVGAQLARMLGASHVEQQEFEQASSLFEEAIALYYTCGQDHELLEVLILKAALLTSMHELPRAIETSQEVLALLEKTPNSRLGLMTIHNLAYQLELSGRLEEALALLDENRKLYRQFPEPWAQFRYAWSRGRIHRGLGNDVEAEPLLRAARDGFLAAGSAYDTALASLDLALLFLMSGRYREIHELLAEALPIFQAQQMNAEAQAAWLLFAQATEAEQLSVELLKRVMRDLGSSRQSGKG